MKREEVDLAIEWAATEGWNPGLNDGDCFYNTDPNGFLIGLLDDKPVAVISAIKYNDHFGFIGFYIVRPGYRGLSYGPLIGKAALEYLNGCNIGLDGVVEKQSNYLSFGFKMAYKNIRYQGLGGGVTPDYPGIVQLHNLPFEKLCEYDESFFPANRSLFLKYWVNQPQSTALGVVKSGHLIGYGVIRICRSGYKIGPLFADTAEVADILFQSLKAKAPQRSPVFLDIPEVNPQAIDLVARYKMSPCFETARMYTGSAPGLPLQKIYGVTSFELG